MKNKKIDFQELIDSKYSYCLSERLQILEWMFKTSKGYDVSYGWYTDGFDKLVYDYSANSHKSYTAIENIEQIWLMFIRAIVISTKIQKWRDDFGIKLGSKRFISFKGRKNDSLFFGKKDIFEIMKMLKNKKLKKEYFHSDYPNRLDPFIDSIKFTISESGCHIFLFFSFHDEKGSSWKEEFWKRDESIEDFFHSSFKTIDSWLESPLIFENL